MGLFCWLFFFVPHNEKEAGGTSGVGLSVGVTSRLVDVDRVQAELLHPPIRGKTRVLTFAAGDWQRGEKIHFLCAQHT